MNFVCFIFIATSYILIGLVSRHSSKNLTNSQNRRQIDQRNRKMNRRIAIIITTDFCCWVPFIVICTLHFFEVLDATPWYSIFSMIILPINSVINPFLYDDVVSGMIRVPFHFVGTKIFNSEVYLSLRRYFRTIHPEVMELPQVGRVETENRT